ncbi:(2Fe-2S)-binding protein [Paradesulfitobacterium ferrireducens]|uniref:(2Fe-2S)-binding protein n=1 Tax=Paradesulfitobacterium ferrireducens TaxID=2816476 RepID=UPI001A8F1D03|nr:(2Fe-2S)-binding protein [Paradesulfitobacterium ferrireducens]
MEAVSSKIVNILVNGNNYEVTVASNDTLLTVLRDKLGLTGTKFGCGNGECGACTVLIDGEAVNSCLVLALNCEGKEIQTIEGLASSNGDLHPIQQAFVDNFAIQCGFCTPGIIMSTKSLLEKNQNPTEYEIREAVNGNICRCTGYENIVKAVSAAAETLRGK